MQYTVVLKSYTGMFRNQYGTSLQRGAGAIPNTKQTTDPYNSGVITAFNETLSLEPVMGEYGMHRAVNSTDQEPISQVYYRGSYSLTISAKSWGNRRKILDNDKQCYSTGQAPGWVIAKDAADRYIRDTRADLNTIDLVQILTIMVRLVLLERVVQIRKGN